MMDVGLVTCSDSHRLDADTAHNLSYAFPLNCPAWQLTDLWPLVLGPEIRNTNVVAPGKPGRRQRRARFDQTDYQLDMLVSGDADRFGVPLAGAPNQNLATNLVTLRDALVRPFNTARTAWRLTDPDGTTFWYAYAIVTRIAKGDIVEGIDARTGRLGTTMKGTLTLRVPAGMFDVAA